MSELAEKYSAACVRSGIAALAAAVVAITLAQKLAVVGPLTSFGNYVLGRELLKLALVELTDSAYWPLMMNALGERAIDPDSLTLQDLGQITCGSENDRKIVWPAKSGNIEVSNATPFAIIQEAVAQSSQPMAPHSLIVQSHVECPGLEDVNDALTNVFADEKSLDTARELSNDADLEIYSWQLARDRLFSKAKVSPAMDSSNVRIIANDRFKWLTLGELKTLDAISYTSIQQFSAIVSSRMNVSTPYTAVNQNATMAAVTVQGVMLVFVAYFFLNLGASVEHGVHEEKGFLLETLMRSGFGKVYFLTLLLVPAAAGSYLAWRMSGTERWIGISMAASTLALTALCLRTIWLAHGLGLRRVKHRRSATR